MEKSGLEPSAEPELYYLFNLYVCSNKEDTYWKEKTYHVSLLCQFLLFN
jgi:hypothetical protein